MHSKKNDVRKCEAPRKLVVLAQTLVSSHCWHRAVISRAEELSCAVERRLTADAAKNLRGLFCPKKPPFCTLGHVCCRQHGEQEQVRPARARLPKS